VNQRLPAGAYEALHTRALDKALGAAPEGIPHFNKVEPAEAPEILARHVADAVRRTLHEAPHDQRLEKINGFLAQVADDTAAVAALEQLLALALPEAPGVYRLVRPATPLSDVALLTNTRGEPSLGAELRAELTSADQVDLLCAFIRWHGIRILTDELETLRARGVPLRVITTTYRGATERRALDELVRQFGAEVRIRYDAQSTRLHAKAWLFRRNSGFDTGYVGSSNLSKSALLEGLEWNVRISAVATPTLVRKFEATFDTYWNNPDFRPYDPDRDGELLERALASEGSANSTITLSGLEVRPRPHQERILEALDAERTVHDRHRNLVVAATGTGKTVIAALDYQRLRQESPDRSLLFVAHRKEILDQALRTYREVLGEGTFGELYVGGQHPQQWQHVFASVQSLSTVDTLPQFDIVVIDEFHHAEAATYRRLLNLLQPGELLGPTATPERADGTDVRSFFSGRTAYDLPLAEALDQDLLCPFHYFGIADNTDLTAIGWSRGDYDVAGLAGLYTGNDARARLVLKALDRQVTDTSRMRALGFCVSVTHAQYALYARLAAADGPSYGSLSPTEQVFARMLYFSLWPNRGDFASYDHGLAQLRAHPAVAAEITQLVTLTTDQARHIPQPLGIPGVTLLSHASYRREEILSGIGWASWTRKPHGRAAGVAWASESGVDALFVTLRKEEGDFSPTTRYRDYPLAADLFHWESQNNTSLSSPTGRRYLAGGSRVLLFVRTARTDDVGSAPYLCLGEVTLAEHRGERPIAITWCLHRPMPPEVLQQGAVASG